MLKNDFRSEGGKPLEPWGEKTPILSSDTNLLKFGTDRLHGKRDRETLAAMDLTRGGLAAGQSVSELWLRDKLEGHRYRDRESISALRRLHSRYPTQTRLALEKGIWVLSPVRCADYDCQDRFVCADICRKVSP